MKQKFLTVIQPLYKSRNNNSYDIRIRMRLEGEVDPAVLREAVDLTMGRYPYFCVKLVEDEDGFAFLDNPASVVIGDSSKGIELNSEQSNYHMISFSRYDNWIIIDIFHGLTDGTGAYEVIRTFLYYYCSTRYNVKLSREGIRTLEDDIPMEEWECPVAKMINELPTPTRHEMPAALNIIAAAKLKTEKYSVAYSVVAGESAFMSFCKENAASPATMVSLLSSRAIAKLFPNAKEPIRIVLPVNQRKALHAPLAHQNLVGGAVVEYKEELRKLPLREQIKAYREMVAYQTKEENMLAGVANMAGLTKMILSKTDTAERLKLARSVDNMASHLGTACVSYVGKANFKDAEKYVREFHVWSYNSFPITIEVSAVNGKFYFDIFQKFHGSLFVDAFFKELAKHGLSCELQDEIPREMANIKLPWNE